MAGWQGLTQPGVQVVQGVCACAAEHSKMARQRDSLFMLHYLRGLLGAVAIALGGASVGQWMSGPPLAANVGASTHRTMSLAPADERPDWRASDCRSCSA